MTPLYPLEPGRVTKVFVHDGDHVDDPKTPDGPKTPLFELDSQAARDLIVEAQADLDDAAIQQKNANLLQADAQLQLDQANKLEAEHKAQIDGQTAAVEARKQQAAAAHAAAGKAHRLTSGADKLIPEEDVAAADALAKAADAATAAEQAKLDLLKLDDPSFGLRRAQNALEAAKNAVQRAGVAVAAKQAQLNAANDKLREYTVMAPKRRHRRAGAGERRPGARGRTRSNRP